MADAKEKAKGRALTIVFGVADIVAAILLYVGVFEGLPARYWLVDSGAALVIALFAASGVGLLAQTRWAPRAALASAVISLVLGLALVTTLALTASYLSGVYGPVGRGGSLILGLIAAMALPYLVVLPLAQLVFCARAGRLEKAEERSPEPARAARPASSES